MAKDYVARAKEFAAKSPADWVCELFLLWARGFDNLDQLGDFEYFFDYAVWWIERGDAVEAAGGDYADFMSGIALAMATYINDPSVLDYGPAGHTTERRVLTLMDPNLDMSAGRLLFDRTFWNREVLSFMAGARLRKPEA